MPGGKLARLLQVVGGASRDDPTSPGGANRTRLTQVKGTDGKHKAAQPHERKASRGSTHATPSAPGEATAARNRKRRRGKPTKQQGSKGKRFRREAGPATKINAATATGKAPSAVAQALSEELELLVAEREQLLGNRSAYEVLMDGLVAHRGGGGSSGKVNLRAHLQLLRNEQEGESSGSEDEEEDEEEDESSSGEQRRHQLRAAKRRSSGPPLASEGAAGCGLHLDLDRDDGEAEEDGKEGEERGVGSRSAVAAKAYSNVRGTTTPGRRRGGGGNRGDGSSPGDVEGDGDEGDEEEEEAEQEAGVDGGVTIAGTAGRDSTPAGAVDTWASHVSKELSDAEVAILASAGKGGAYRDAPAADEVHLTAWGPSSKWQLRMYGSNGSGTCGKAGRNGEKAGEVAAAAAAPSMGLTELPPTPATLPEYGVKERLVSRWREVRQEDEAREVAGVGGRDGPHPHSGREHSSGDFRDPQQQSLFALLNAYVDIHLPCRPYPTDPSLDAPDWLLDAVLLHCLNHVSKTADRIKKNNQQLVAVQQQQQVEQRRLLLEKQQQLKKRKQQRSWGKSSQQQQQHEMEEKEGSPPTDDLQDKEEDEEADLEQQQQQHGEKVEKQDQKPEGGLEGTRGPHEHIHDYNSAAAHLPGGEGATPRDQGFIRPKVLLLLPQRNFAFRAVRRLVALAIRETRTDSVQGKERFVEQFTDPEEGDQSEEKLAGAARARLFTKPAEHRALFAGNVDDHFRLGIKVTKSAIRLFADLYDSDIIVASPVGLATKLAEDKAADPHSRPDFLSSIEVLVLDRADVMSMQNWAHVETVVSALNQLPREQHGTDIMRVRDWYLSGLAVHYRQTILMASFSAPHTNALARSGANHGGSLRLMTEQVGVLGRVVPQVRQVFERFPAASPAAAGDARFEFFMRSVWPRVKDCVSRGLLLFIPSYFDFVRLRNALKADDSVDFASISEYSSDAEVTRARGRFYHGQRRMLLYTERAHFYHRFRIRGIQDLLFYGLPEHGEYYSELVNLLEEGGGGGGGAGASRVGHQATVTALFCSWDVLQLERVVGSVRAKRMLKGKSGTYMFC